MRRRDHHDLRWSCVLAMLIAAVYVASNLLSDVATIMVHARLRRSL